MHIGPGRKTRSGDDVPPTLDLDAMARFNDANGQRFFQLGYRSVKFLHYVGYVQVGRVAFEVLPKADRAHSSGSGARGQAGRWKKALLEMLEVATGMRLHAPSDSAQAVERSSLLDLLVTSFLDEVARVLREGLARSYRPVETNGATFRGRLLVSENLRENLVRPDRFFVRYATFSSDIVVNRVVGAALEVAAELPVSPQLRARCHEYALAFADLTPVRSAAQLLDRLTLGRSTVRYEKALLLARMILEQVAPTLEHGRTDVFAFLFDMNLLWESYVATLFRRAKVQGLSVRTQESRLFWKSLARAKKTVRPDIVVYRVGTNEAVLVVDTKWKVHDGGPPADDDLKQMFVYNELFACADSVLMYPSRHAETKVAHGTFSVARQHVCRTSSLGLFDGDDLRTSAMVMEVAQLLALAKEKWGAAAEP